MVKLGPKPLPPSLRELEKTEKQQKRISQLENGFGTSVSGEPKEHLNFLFPQTKRSRSRRLGYPVLEQARRKWEKNRLRTQARRLAKKNATTSLQQGDDNWSDPFENVTGNETVISDGKQTIQNLLADNSLIWLRLGDTLDNELADNFHDTTAEDHLQNQSSGLGFNTPPAAPPPLPPFLYGGSDLVPGPSSVTAPHLDTEIATDLFWRDKNLLRSSSSDLKDYDAVRAEPTRNSSAQITPTANKQIVGKAHAPLPSPNGFVDSIVIRKSRSVRFGTLSTSSPRVCTKKGSDRSFTFSEPMDPATYRAKTWLDSSYDSLEEYRALSNAKPPVQKATEPYSPYNFLGSSLSSGSMLSASSNTLTGLQVLVNITRGNSSDVHGLGHPDCKAVPLRTRDTDEWKSDSQFTAKYLSDISLDCPSNSVDVFPTDSHSQSPPDPTNTDLFGIVVRPRIPNPRPAPIIYPRPVLEQTKATSYLRSHIEGGTFSSNRYIFEKGNKNIGDIKNSSSPGHSFDSYKTPSSPSLLRTWSKSVSNAVHTLAPAASIVQVKKMRKPIDDVDKMEKGSPTRFSHPEPQPRGFLG